MLLTTLLHASIRYAVWWVLAGLSILYAPIDALALQVIGGSAQQDNKGQRYTLQEEGISGYPGTTWTVGRVNQERMDPDSISHRFVPPLQTDPTTVIAVRLPGGSMVSPAFSYELNSEDGIFLGSGVQLTVPAHSNGPFASRHALLFRQSLFTRAYIASYDAAFPSLVGNWDGVFQVNYLSNNNIRNFYGFGNNSDGSNTNRLRYRALYDQLIVEAVMNQWYSFYRSISFSTRLEYMNINPLPEGPFPSGEDTGFVQQDFEDKLYLGARVAFSIDRTDTLTVTRSGARWLNSVSLHQGVHNTSKRYLTLFSEFSYFYPIVLSGDLSFAFRIGGTRHIGKFEFYQANYISGRQTVRGYEKNRFAGHSNFYNNYEFRARLFNVKAFWLNTEAGILAFFDHGRVWSDVDTKNVWHAGYGGGVWGIPFKGVVGSATYGVTREGPLLDFFLRFLF